MTNPLLSLLSLLSLSFLADTPSSSDKINAHMLC